LLDELEQDFARSAHAAFGAANCVHTVFSAATS
jgi:hypothetical protein